MCSQENYIDRFAFSVNFSNCQFGFPVLEYYLVVEVHLHIWLTFTVNKMMWKHIFIEFWGKLQDLNINKSYFCKSDTNRRNFNWRSRYKNLFYVLNSSRRYLCISTLLLVNMRQPHIQWGFIRLILP